MELWDELIQLENALDVTVKTLRKCGIAYAEAERDYKIKLAETCLRLRDEGMAVGMIDKVCYGVQAVANKRFERDVAEATYKANQEAINALKLKIRIHESQLDREWGQAK